MRQPKTRSKPLQTRARDSTWEWLEDCLAGLPDFEVRRMFSGAGLFAEGTMFGVLFGGHVYLKTDEATRAAFLERGLPPLRVRQETVLTSYYQAPPALLDDEDELRRWARQALEVARRALHRPKTKAKKPVEPEQILAGHAAAVRELAERLRQLVKAEVPQASELGYPGWRLIGYRAPHYFCFVAPQAEEVVLGFENGRELADPDGLLAPLSPKSRQVRCVRLRPGKRLPVAALRRLVRAALELGPKSPAAKAHRSARVTPPVR